MTSQFPFESFLNLEEIKDQNNQEIKVDYSLNQKPEKEFNKTETNEILKITTHEIIKQLKLSIEPSQFKAYFENSLTVSSINDETIHLMVKTPFIKKIIESQYLTSINNALFEMFNKNLNVVIETVNINNQTSTSSPKNKNQTFILEEENPLKTNNVAIKDNKNVRGFLDPQKNFHSFIVGPSNNLAYAAAKAVAKNPGASYTTLYIYGKSGLGKTHLIHSIANELSQNNSLKIEITTCHTFIQKFVEAIHKREIDVFKKNYENIDVLIIDDIHELQNKEASQENFFHILNDLTNRKKQLIFTSDKTPREINGIEDRLRSRLASALVVEIHQPDLETRIAILKSKALENDLFINDDVVNLIAKCIKQNVRELEGSLVSLGAYSSFNKVEIDVELAKQILKLSEQADYQKNINIDSITKIVASYYKVPINDLKGKGKTKAISFARQVAMYLIYNHLKKTLFEIALYFNRKDHTTVMYGIKVIKEKMSSDSSFAQNIVEIESLF